MVIAARKGVPNFNEFTLRTDILTQAKTRSEETTPFDLPNATNQMYLLGISNYFGVEAWYPYNGFYPREVTLAVSNTTDDLADE
jgi:hypothetical protein